MSRKGIRSLAALARRTGLHRNTVGRFVWKQEPVLPDSVSRILDTLGLEPAEAFLKVDSSPLAERAREALAKIIDRLVEDDCSAAYVLFGSRARGKSRDYSDFDIGVFSSDSLPLSRYLRMLDVKSEVEDELPWFIDLVNLNSADSKFLHDIGGDLRFLGGRQGDWQALLLSCDHE